MIDQLETDFVMAKNTAIFSVANTIKMHIQKNIHFIYKQDFYKDYYKEIYELFTKCLVPVTDNLDHPELIEEWKQNLDAVDHDKI